MLSLTLYMYVGPTTDTRSQWSISSYRASNAEERRKKIVVLHFVMNKSVVGVLLADDILLTSRDVSICHWMLLHRFFLYLLDFSDLLSLFAWRTILNVSICLHRSKIIVTLLIIINLVLLRCCSIKPLDLYIVEKKMPPFVVIQR